MKDALVDSGCTARAAAKTVQRQRTDAERLIQDAVGVELTGAHPTGAGDARERDERRRGSLWVPKRRNPFEASEAR